ncbi:MAG: hypothetical protein H7172_08620 [Ferruginibacter sp.]|nr:hypothetical protein [Rhodoferax sp.]
MRIIKTAWCALSVVIGLGACAGHNLLGQVVDDNVYFGGVALPKGPVVIGRSYSFRFVEKWRISHAWIQGTGVEPCHYRGNIFKRFPNYQALATDVEGPMFEHDGRIYFGGVKPKNPEQILFWELSYQFLGERMSDRGFDGKFQPFCGQAFQKSRNGMTLSIVKPDPEKGTDAWVKGAVPMVVNGRTWLIKTVPPQDLSGTGLTQPIEYWTLKIPDTPYWMNLRFSASLDHSIHQYGAENIVLLNLFHQVIESVKLEPITPVDPASMPPFVLAY